MSTICTCPPDPSLCGHVRECPLFHTNFAQSAPNKAMDALEARIIEKSREIDAAIQARVTAAEQRGYERGCAERTVRNPTDQDRAEQAAYENGLAQSSDNARDAERERCAGIARRRYDEWSRRADRYEQNDNDALRDEYEHKIDAALAIEQEIRDGSPAPADPRLERLRELVRDYLRERDLADVTKHAALDALLEEMGK